MNKEDQVDDFANDKEILRQRKEKAMHLQMITDSIKIVKDAFNAKTSSRRNLKSFILYQSIKRPLLLILLPVNGVTKKSTSQQFNTTLQLELEELLIPEQTNTFLES